MPRASRAYRHARGEQVSLTSVALEIRCLSPSLPEALPTQSLASQLENSRFNRPSPTSLPPTPRHLQ